MPSLPVVEFVDGLLGPVEELHPILRGLHVALSLHKQVVKAVEVACVWRPTLVTSV